MPLHTRFILPALLLLAAGIFLTGINWGLPSRAADPFLFAKHPVWSGEKVLALAGPTEDANRGADVASHAGEDRSAPILVNASDADRARIVRRFRLMSYQPDEWNTLKALSEMKPTRGNLDPKLYQYGGLWVYPVGGLLKTAAIVHLIDLRADVTWYLDHPEGFGRFYIVARLWSVMWGLVGVVAVYAIVRRIVGGMLLPIFAGVAFCFLPVVVNMAHEAKPHLAGAVLMLLAVLVASRYVERGTRCSWMLAGALCGAALAMVLTAMPIFLILPGMIMLRRSSWRQKCLVAAGAIAMGGLVYLLTNPYVPFNFLFHRGLLESNLVNSKAMYHPGLGIGAMTNTAYLIAAGTSPFLALAGVVGTVALGIRALRMRGSQDNGEIRRRATGLLLAIPALAITIQCVLVAEGKPGEFGRFLLFPDLFLLIEAMVALQAAPWHGTSASSVEPRPARNFPSDHGRAAHATTWSPRLGRFGFTLAILLIIATAISGLSYLRGFIRDSRLPTLRLIEAAKLKSSNPTGASTLAVYADPAPYCLPPVNLFDGKIVLLPRDAPPNAGVEVADFSIRAVDVPNEEPSWLALFTATPISWADKPWDLRVRR